MRRAALLLAASLLAALPSRAALVVLEGVNTFAQFACAGAGGQQQEAEGEAGH